jgi:hypothetical protein
MNAPLNLTQLRPASGICLKCKVPMEEKASIKADVIQFSTRTKMVVYKCWNCGMEPNAKLLSPLLSTSARSTERSFDWPSAAV